MDELNPKNFYKSYMNHDMYKINSWASKKPYPCLPLHAQNVYLSYILSFLTNHVKKHSLLNELDYQLESWCCQRLGFIYVNMSFMLHVSVFLGFSWQKSK
jgi:hypothetical protein